MDVEHSIMELRFRLAEIDLGCFPQRGASGEQSPQLLGEDLEFH